jgi:hypothetical protein
VRADHPLRLLLGRVVPGGEGCPLHQFQLQQGVRLQRGVTHYLNLGEAEHSWPQTVGVSGSERVPPLLSALVQRPYHSAQFTSVAFPFFADFVLKVVSDDGYLVPGW